MKQGIFLVLLAAVGLDGALCAAGSLVEVTDTEARNLLHRGKARLATAEDMPAQPADEDEAKGPTREDLAQALAALPGEQTDPDYVVSAMLAHFGELFTADDEKQVRKLVKKPAATK